MGKHKENQITEMLRKMKKRRWRMPLLLCLAMLVSLAPAGAFQYPASAESGQVRVLACTAEPPKGEACADFFIHVHNADCFDAHGNLVCPLPEIKPHHHTEDCFSTTKKLICTIPESEEHQHDDSCYETVTAQICGKREVELHTHTEDCYERNEDGSFHTDEHGRPKLICGKVQVLEHVHGPECFTDHNPDAPEGTETEGPVFFTTETDDDESPEGEATADADAEEGRIFFLYPEEEEEESEVGSEAEAGAESEGGLIFLFPEEDEDESAAPVPEEEPINAQTEDAEPAGEASAAAAAADETPADTEESAVPAGKASGEDGTAEPKEETDQAADPAAAPSEDAAAEKPADLSMPAQKFSGQTDDVLVLVTAPEGAFPEGTTMQVAMVEIDADTMSSVEEVVEGKVTVVQALDISFFDAEGNKIEPLKPIQVSMKSALVSESENVSLIHKPDAGEEAGPEAEAPALEVLEAAVVAQDDASAPSDEITFESDAFSVYMLVGTTIEKKVLASDGHNYKITLTYGPEAGIPEDAELAVEEILPDSEEYQAYLEMAEASVENEMVSFARFFDITILSGGVEVQPAAQVEVKIELADELDESAKAVHFGDEVEFIDAELAGLPEAAGNDEPTVQAQNAEAAENAGSEMAFSAESFSVYGVIMTTLEKTITASDGNTYSISVTYGADAKIPVDAVLSVEEILSESERYNEYVSETETVLGLEAGSLPYARFFDITILGAEEEKLQPAEGTTVEVKIELADVKDGKSLNIVHFAESQSEDKMEPELLESVTEGAAVSFRTSGFSVYAVAENVDLGALNNKTYGLINTTDGAKPSGVAMMSTAQSNGTKLQGKSTTVRINTVNRTDYVYVANNSNITMWTFYEASAGKYYITTQAGGQTKYLNVSSNGISLVNDSSEAGCVFTVSAGTGTNAGKNKFSTTNGVLRLNGSSFERAAANYNKADAWMNFAELSELNEDDFVTYTAQKVSISEAAGEVQDGDPVILYTRIWNDNDHRYDYYVVDYDGKLVKAYESGDTISWVGSQVNTMLWDFKEHYYDGTSTPNGYYDLSNLYSGKFIAPKTSNGTETFFADSPYGVNLNGRGNGDYYTTILAWDDYYYASLKVDEEQIALLSSTLSQASDFYFAKMSTDTETMEVTTVSTVDSTQFGITLKMQDFGENDNLTSGRSAEMSNILGNTPYNQWTGSKELLQNYIAGGSDYPIATNSNKSLGALFSNPLEVNHQFLTTTYYETGYFEYDSTQNFAHLITSASDPWYGVEAPSGGTYGVGDFVIYGQLGTSSEGNKDTLRHGQFLPYNDIIGGFKTDEEGNPVLDENGNRIPIPIKVSTQYSNTHDIHADPLSSLDPAYGEKLYEISWNKTHKLPYVDHFFGMEMSASFMQSASGLDAWGHDLIFEFSGDDDFWLYVDDVLVLDLGGIHSALDGNVNFRTGEIVENGKSFTLKERFEEAYRAQHAGEENLEQNLQNWLKGIFKVETVAIDGEERETITDVFKDYSSHTMRMFYLERGAGASNLHMRFNISEYKDGGIQLQKKVSGTENSDQLFPFQIWYQDPGTYEMVRANGTIAVTDSQTGEQVPYEAEYSVQAGDDTLVYENVFFLKAGQTVNIQLPSEDTAYYIRECAMDSPATYDWVKINDIKTAGSKVSPQKYNDSPVTQDTVIPNSGLLDFNAAQATVSERKKVIYENHVDQTAMKNLTIKKRLWQDEGRTTEIFSGTGEYADNTEFSFRVYIGMAGETYTIYKNGPYRVKNPAGEYCYFHNGAFVSTGKKVFGEITDDIVNYNREILQGDTLQQRCTFHTGRGSITKIKAGYTVEIPGLLNGTPFIVAERDGEIPSGYNRLGYEANGSGSVVSGELLTGTTEDREAGLLMAGTINGDQEVTVHNQHGYTLIAKKVWSDAAFMDNHDEIYFAVYREGDLSLIDGSVRQLGKTGTSLSWFFPELEAGKNLNDYVVYEVMLKVPEGSSLVVDSSGKVTGYTTVSGDTTAITEENLIRIKEGDVLTAGGQSNEHGYSASMEYVAGYSREVLKPGTDGKYPNVRTDTVSNSRPGIKIVKTDINGVPLEGAGFTFSNQNSLTKTFSSDQNGLVVVAYLLPDKDYLLTESDAPYGYRSLIDSLTIRVDENGTVYVNGLDTDPENGSYTITQVQNWTAANMPTVTIKNQGVALKAVKIDSDSGRPLSDVKFALYKEVFATTGGMPDPTRPMPDYTPMEGYEALFTDDDGVIPKIVLKNAENPDGLPAGHYYLREEETPAGYVSLGIDIRINLSSSGQVTIQSAKRPAQAGKDWVIGDVPQNVASIDQISDSLLQITLKNTPKDPVRIKKVEMLSGKSLTGVKFELYRSNQVDEDGLPKKGETPVIEGTTDANGILLLGGLEGLYFLYETETLPGYSLLPGAIRIQSSAETNNVTAFLSGTRYLECKKITENGNTVWQIKVENSTGYELPQTGGEGTLLFSVFGTILVLTSTLFILAKRKREAYVPRL